MIKFDYAGKKYELEFSYGDEQVGYGRVRDGKPSFTEAREYTTIRLREVGGYSAVSSVTRHYKDKHNLENARRAALAKLLASWPEFTKQFRWVVWYAYFLSSECKKSARPGKQERGDTIWQ